MKRRALALWVVGGISLFLLGLQWHQGSTGHCAAGNWTSHSESKSLEILEDKIAILNRLTTSSGWSDACNWNAINEKAILLECSFLGAEKKFLKRFQCGNTNEIGYLYEGMEPSGDSLVMYRSE